MISASEFQESSSDKLLARFALHMQVYLQQIWCRSNTKSTPKSSQVRESVTRFQEGPSPSIFSSVGSGRGSRQDSRMRTSKQTKAHCCNISQPLSTRPVRIEPIRCTVPGLPRHIKGGCQNRAKLFGTSVENRIQDNF